jgi:hypothetical protein
MHGDDDALQDPVNKYISTVSCAERMGFTLKAQEKEDTVPKEKRLAIFPAAPL